ncbi:ATP-binding protein [Sphingomonas sanxanigenens]|uniref:OmpR/PhoB-type domain-containing protein n=1 Tax=Sphingomonas sanxanigenens DSM 19645 = NX02 TaxID=1123269 RepID=W0A4N9_9SPHN|nr:winged helix-turn-helix domain-containing protein [Sphingomonas sanxanigenens]AHE52929.1 hypothetical protein NX02_05985 [Sphingomonas sanxanigenens DSM 19645 = NX02]
MAGAEAFDVTTYCFGDYRFTPARQSLLRGEVPIRVGGRAMDLLHALVRRPGEVVSKDELFRAAWPNIFVEESNLKVNISALRRALQAGTDLPIIATIPGRGYKFVASLQILGRAGGTIIPDTIRGVTGELPSIPMLIGRDEALAEIIDALNEVRLLTIVGSPGVGKTSLAIAAAQRSDERLRDELFFIDFAPIEDPQLIVPAIAFGLGLDIDRTNILSGIVESLHDRRLLLVLDNCEHLLNAAATVADHLTHALPKLTVLATSREPLRCRWESVFRLAALNYPVQEELDRPATALSFAAVELLARRAESQGYRMAEADLPQLAAISRRLEGIALAIELAAPHLASGGPSRLLALLKTSFESLVGHTDAGAPRHRTLTATLHWSYRLLSPNEAYLFRHLSVFGGAFALDDVVGTCGHVLRTEDIAAWLENLAAKSLLSTTYQGGQLRYRLLDSSRHFAAQRLLVHGEQPKAMAGYAYYLLALFNRAEGEWYWRAREDWIALYGYRGIELRRAIEWAFGADGDMQLGIRLTAAGIPLWHELSSFAENRTRVDRALEAIETLPLRDDLLKLKLIVAHIVNLRFDGASRPSLNAALTTGMRMATELNAAEYRIRLTYLVAGNLWLSGRSREALATIRRTRDILDTAATHPLGPDLQKVEFSSRLCCGEVRRAHRGLTKLSAEHPTVAHRSGMSRLVVDRCVSIRTLLALSAWMIGDQRQALDASEDAVAGAVTLDHVLSNAYALCVGAIPVAIESGLLDLAEQHISALFVALDRYEIGTWEPFAQFYRATIDAESGDHTALDRMQSAIDRLVRGALLLHFPMRMAMLARSALSHGRPDIAHSAVAQGLDHAKRHGEHWYDGELLRIRGLVRWQEGDALGAGQMLQRALQIVKCSGAASFESRMINTIATLGI